VPFYFPTNYNYTRFLTPISYYHSAEFSFDFRLLRTTPLPLHHFRISTPLPLHRFRISTSALPPLLCGSVLPIFRATVRK